MLIVIITINITVKIPIDTSVNLSKNREKKVKQLEYSLIIRSLIYIINCIRFNIL
jgi:hypothetical protein